MSDAFEQPDALEQRLARIEASLQRIEEQLGTVPAEREEFDGTIEQIEHAEQAEQVAEEAAQAPPRDATPAPAEPSRDETLFETPTAFAVENWIDKIGIALLLLGLGFLFKLSVEMGLLTAPIKVALGALVGVGLGVAGWRVREDRLRLSQILLGGSSAALYITLFAAYYFYDLLPHAVAFAGMSGVTMATFVLATRERDAALAIVGALGGFATPLVLSSGSGDYVGLTLYNSVLVAGMTAIYLIRGWKSLLAVNALGGWLLAAIALVAFDQADSTGPVEAAMLQAGVLLVWVATGLVPAVRDHLRGHTTASWLTHLLALGSPLLGLLASRALWDIPDGAWAAGYVALTAAYALGGRHLADRQLAGLAATFRFVAALMLTLAVVTSVPLEHLAAALALEAVALHFVGRRLDETPLLISGHLLALTAIGLMFETAIGAVTGLPFLNPDGLVTLTVLASLLAISFSVDSKTSARVYRYPAHALLLVVLLDQTAHVAHGDLFGTACWGAYAIGLLVAGIYKDIAELQYVGLATVLLAVGKLLWLDMAGTETLWRVLLFLAFGAALLAVSYFAPALGGRSESADGADKQISR